MRQELVERAKRGDREAFGRLVAVKDRYDPANCFRANRDIKPSA